MEIEEESKFVVIVTDPAEIRFYEVLDYLFDNYSFERTEEIANEIRNTAKGLKDKPQRGAIEKSLLQRRESYRFILYNRSKRAEIKIIYFIDESRKTVYVTDFFPTEKDDSKIPERNY